MAPRINNLKRLLATAALISTIFSNEAMAHRWGPPPKPQGNKIKKLKKIQQNKNAATAEEAEQNEYRQYLSNLNEEKIMKDGRTAIAELLRIEGEAVSEKAVITKQKRTTTSYKAFSTGVADKPKAVAMIGIGNIKATNGTSQTDGFKTRTLRKKETEILTIYRDNLTAYLLYLKASIKTQGQQIDSTTLNRIFEDNVPESLKDDSSPQAIYNYLKEQLKGCNNVASFQRATFPYGFQITISEDKTSTTPEQTETGKSNDHLSLQ